MEYAPLSNDDLVVELYRRFRCYQDKINYRIVFLGVPGSGKGTNSFKLSQRYCLCHLSTGDMLRKEVQSGSEFGKLVSQIMNAGKLVPDNTIIDIIMRNLDKPQCKNGAVLDGFPRTIPQAKALDDVFAAKGQKVDQAILLNATEETVMQRVFGRLVHPQSGRTYHKIYNPPMKADCDDITGEPLTQRDDDKQNIIQARLTAYFKRTTPIIDYYRQKGILREIDGERTMHQVWRDIKGGFH